MIASDQFNPQFVVDSNGQRKAVILPLDEYEALLEDLSDLAVAAERKEEGTISHDQLLKDLEADGSI
ncbi:MAG: hypothetical protein JXB30_00490 [Anaerolineae bacterium]|nr:hypothetical protein [Anaerolineae bacterium]